MSIHKRPTNKAKTKFTWGYIVDVPSGEFDINGNPTRKQKAKWGFEKREEAKKAERKFLNNLEAGIITIDEDSLFSDIASAFFKYIEESPDYAKGTIKNYRGYYNNHLKPFHNLKLRNITSLFIENWVVDMQKAGKSPYIINGCRKFAIASFNYAKKHKLIGFNPFIDCEKVSEPKVLRHRFSIDEIKKLHQVCNEKMPEFYCIFSLAIFTGMRLGEYSAIEKEDIDLKKNQIWIQKQYTNRELKNRNKTKESRRIVDFPPSVGEIIKWHIKKHKIFSGFLFKGKKEMPVSANWVNSKFDDLLVLCGYTSNYIRLHDLRGQFVDIMHTLGMPDVYISRQVGHARTSTTNDVYSYIMSEVHTNATSQLERVIFS